MKHSLGKSAGALSALHKSVFPKGTPPTTVEALAEVFSPGSSTLADYTHTQTVCGLESAFLLMLGHGIAGDFEKVIADFPRKP